MGLFSCPKMQEKKFRRLSCAVFLDAHFPPILICDKDLPLPRQRDNKQSSTESDANY